VIANRLLVGYRVGMTLSRLALARCFSLLPLTIGLSIQAAMLDDLARPQEGRSMRATSTFRAGRDGKYDPKADPKGDRDEQPG
jgi:hypothetical protein